MDHEKPATPEMASVASHENEASTTSYHAVSVGCVELCRFEMTGPVESRMTVSVTTELAFPALS